MGVGAKNRPAKHGMRNITAADIVFLAVFAALSVLFLCTAPYGITVSDESMYQTFCQRIADGDRLFVDDLMISNLLTVFTYLPFRFFTAVLGGTEGLVLALRYLYVGIKMSLFAWLYFRLRRYRYWAILAGVLFAGTDLFGLKTTNYYSVCVHAVCLAGMLLFVTENRKPLHCVAAGFLFSLAVIAEPVAAFVWLAYCVLVLVYVARRKKHAHAMEAYAFILAPRIWLYVFFGVCAALAAFIVLCAAMFTGTDLQSIAAGLGQMAEYITYGNGTGGSTLLIRLYKPLMYLFYYGPYFMVPFAVLLVLTLVPNRFAAKHKNGIFTALSVLYMLMSVHLILYPAYKNGNDAAGEAVSHPLLLPLLSLAAYALTNNKNKKLFAFLLTSIGVSFAVDCFSNNSLGSVLLSGSVPAVLLLREYYIERRGEIVSASAKTRPAKDRVPVPDKKMGALLCVLLVFIPAFEAWHCVYMARLHETERFFCMSAAPLDAEITQGVLKGVVTTAELKENYDKSVRDAERIRAICKKGLIAVDYDTTVYLNAGVRVFTPATHIVGNDWHTEEAWWALHPEKRPDVAYIPFFTLSYIEFNDITPEEKLAYFERNADITVTRGEIGYIVKIERWH